jgi:hypothetical protein
MPYVTDGAVKARAKDHCLEYLTEVEFEHPEQTVTKYYCPCGNCEVQISSSARIGIWVSDCALKPCRGPRR